MQNKTVTREYICNYSKSKYRYNKKNAHVYQTVIVNVRIYNSHTLSHTKCVSSKTF